MHKDSQADWMVQQLAPIIPSKYEMSCPCVSIVGYSDEMNLNNLSN